MKSVRNISTSSAMVCLVLTVAAAFTTQCIAGHRAAVVSDPVLVTPEVALNGATREITRGHLENERPEVETQVIAEQAESADVANQSPRPAGEFDSDLLSAMHPLMTVPPRPGLRP